MGQVLFLVQLVFILLLVGRYGCVNTTCGVGASSSTEYYCSDCGYLGAEATCDGCGWSCTGGVNTSHSKTCSTCRGAKKTTCSVCKGNATITTTCEHSLTAAHRYCEHSENTDLTEHYYCAHNINGVEHE